MHVLCACQLEEYQTYKWNILKGKPSTLAQPPRHWYSFGDGTFFIQQKSHKQLFQDHINSIDPAIKFTVEGNQENGSIPFLDTLVKPEADNSISISVYRKPTHTDQDLQWDSHHNLAAKLCHWYPHPQDKNSLYQTGALQQRNSTPSLGRLYPGANTPDGLWIRFKVSLLPANERKVTLNRTTQVKGKTTQIVPPQRGVLCHNYLSHNQ